MSGCSRSFGRTTLQQRRALPSLLIVGCIRCGGENLFKEMIKDEELLDIGLAAFGREGYAKFVAGIREHNPEGKTHLCRLSARKIVGEMKKEAIDQWFYACALESKLQE